MNWSVQEITVRALELVDIEVEDGRTEKGSKRSMKLRKSEGRGKIRKSTKITLY